MDSIEHTLGKIEGLLVGLNEKVDTVIAGRDSDKARITKLESTQGRIIWTFGGVSGTLTVLFTLVMALVK